MGHALQGGDIGQHRSPAFAAGGRRRARRGPGHGPDHHDDLPGGNQVPGGQRLQIGDDARAGSANRGFHLHRRDDQQGLADGYRCSGPDQALDDRTGLRRLHALVALGTDELLGLWLAAPRLAPQCRGLLIRKTQGRRPLRRRSPAAGGGDRRPARCARRRREKAWLRMLRNARRWWHAGDLELVERAQCAIDS
jgi:hypothetical protein